MRALYHSWSDLAFSDGGSRAILQRLDSKHLCRFGSWLDTTISTVFLCLYWFFKSAMPIYGAATRIFSSAKKSNENDLTKKINSTEPVKRKGLSLLTDGDPCPGRWREEYRHHVLVLRCNHSAMIVP